MHDGLQKPLHGPAIKPLTIECHSVNLASSGLCVDGIGHLNLAACTRGLPAQDLKSIGR